MIREKMLALLKKNIKKIQKFHIQKIAIFGSVARDEETSQSDIDILITFDISPTFDLYMDLKFFLEDLLGRKVDLIIEDSVRPVIRSYIEKDLIRVA